MQELRVTFRIASSLGTPFQADTIFGHICWALHYLEGDDAVSEFLAEYSENDSPPLLISDGFPEVDGLRYLPRPNMPTSFREVSTDLGIKQDDLAEWRIFTSAAKSLDKKPYVEESVLLEHADPLDNAGIARDVFALKVCPETMAPIDRQLCDCKRWQDCPALGGNAQRVCKVVPLRCVETVTMHNVINRWKCSSENLYARREWFTNYGFYFLARIDDKVMTKDRLAACMEYIEGSGYGRDRSTGMGAIRDVKIEDVDRKAVKDANGFINLSSAYVPRCGELGRGFYSVHVKRGKLGEGYIHTYSPFKRPVLMIEAGAVLEGDPCVVHGGLISGVHYQAPKIVQYGYAYPLAVKIDEKAL
jgi:CRISPR type III-A-associated RAMP protein Csm4